MTQLAQTDYAQISELLTSIGHKYRFQQVLRGVMRFVATVVLVSLMAGMIAHWCGAGIISLSVMIVWAAFICLAAIVWVIRPMVARQRPEWVARLIENRVDGLHNALTNSLTLSTHDDLDSSPFTPLIYSEITQQVQWASIDQAIQLRDLYPVIWRVATVVIVSALATLLLWPQLSHGWKQMFAPSAFVPRTSTIEITSLRPGAITLIRGQPLEIVIETSAFTDPDDLTPDVQLYLEPAIDGKTSLPLPMVAPQRFAARIEHIDHPLRYRVEVGGTQSAWYDVKVIDQIKLTRLQLTINHPSYTRRPQQVVAVDPQNMSPVSVSIGSTVEVHAGIDNPLAAAMLQLSEEPPREMKRMADGMEFRAGFIVEKDVPLSILLADAGGQIVARLPEPALPIKALADELPHILMRWPSQDVSIAPDETVTLRAHLRDDIGLTRARVLMSTTPDKPLEMVSETLLQGQANFDLAQQIPIPAEYRKHGTVLRLQVEATDNRDLSAQSGPQTTQSPVYNITLRDAGQIARDSEQRLDQLRDELRKMLIRQQELLTRTVGMKTFENIAPIAAGQTELRDRMIKVADTYAFDSSDANIKKTLYMLARNPAQEAIDLCAALPIEPASSQQARLHGDLQARQRRIISTLESLLAMLVKSPELTEEKTKKGGDLPSLADNIRNLKAVLDEYMKQQQRILDQTAPLAKKPVDDLTDADKKLLDELAMSQEKLDAFMQEKVSDFSKLAEQDMANASLLKELMEVYSEVTMAKDAMKKKETEIAVSAEEMGVELAKEITSNLEKWLVDTPDRIKWDQEDPLTKADVPMAELPEELEDMIGELMEQQEDILEEAEDTNANWADSLDKGAGWDAMDGPIANMSAKGVTGNQLPNNNEMGGRSGEGRSGKSQGEFVEETASGKGGRNTPTRLDPTPFAKGQIKDESKDPVGGATGGGKLSGQGGEGLEGPVAPGLDKQMQRLAQKQAQLRNAAERLNIKYQLGRYDNFKLLESIAIMRRMEADLESNRYQNLLRRKEVLLDTMDTSRMLVGGEIHVQHDTTPQISSRLEDQIHDAMKGDLPPAWSDALKIYYQKLGQK